MIRELRPHQVRAMDLLRQSLGRGKRRPMLQAPTGFGKTLLAAAVVDGALRKGNRVIFTVPALSLVDQTVAAFWDEGIRDVGVIQADHHLTNWSRPVQVASVQTLQRRRIPEADVVVIDEAHRWFEFYGRWMGGDYWKNKPFIGLSATPWTKGLGRYYDDLLIAATTADLIRDGYLSRFRVYAPSHPDLSNVRMVAGDYHEGDLSGVMNEGALVADVVDTWLRKGEGRSTLCFAVDRAHAKSLERKFAEAGVSTGYVDAYTDAAEREAIRRKFHSGEIRIVCNVGCLTTGVDWDVRCIILARPTKSEMLFVQIVGRGLRTAEGKDHCLILDHSDTHLRLGFVTDIHHDALNNGRERPKAERKTEVLPKECPKCTYLKPAKVHVCPACGFKPEPRSTIECEAGELIEITKGKKPKLSSADKARLYGELKYYAARRGYAPGWAANQFRQKTGVWPNAYKDAPLVEPSSETLSWIKSRQIAWAKRKEAANARAA